MDYLPEQEGRQFFSEASFGYERKKTHSSTSSAAAGRGLTLVLGQIYPSSVFTVLSMAPMRECLVTACKSLAKARVADCVRLHRCRVQSYRRLAAVTKR